MQRWQDQFELRDISIAKRYHTIAMIYYRQKLQAEANEIEFDEAEPSLNDGKKLPDGSDPEKKV